MPLRSDETFTRDQVADTARMMLSFEIFKVIVADASRTTLLSVDCAFTQYRVGFVQEQFVDL